MAIRLSSTLARARGVGAGMGVSMGLGGLPARFSGQRTYAAVGAFAQPSAVQMTRLFRAPSAIVKWGSDVAVEASAVAIQLNKFKIAVHHALNSVFENIWLISTLRRRASKMNKHKLKKRRKKLRMNTKQSRG
jgi:hypothetical protein